jgi:hypothetical protein
LKIRVSVVRFRPWPPFKINHLGWLFADSSVSNFSLVPIWCLLPISPGKAVPFDPTWGELMSGGGQIIDIENVVPENAMIRFDS